MKKWAIVFLCIIIAVMMVGCAAEPEQAIPTAIEYVNAFEGAGFPISNVIEYTEETDVNGLLGRPGEYTGKVDWADDRVEQYDEENPVGGTIEVFKSQEDMENRKTYIESMWEAVPLTEDEYIYVSPDGLALMRISYDVSPTAAEQYRTAFEEFCNNGEITPVVIESSASAVSDQPVDSLSENDEEAAYIETLGVYGMSITDMTESLSETVEQFTVLCSMADTAGEALSAEDNSEEIESMNRTILTYNGILALLENPPQACIEGYEAAKDMTDALVSIFELYITALEEAEAGEAMEYATQVTEKYAEFADAYAEFTNYMTEVGY